MRNPDKMSSAQYSEGYEEGLSIGLERGETTGYEARNEEVELLEDTMKAADTEIQSLRSTIEKIRNLVP